MGLFKLPPAQPLTPTCPVCRERTMAHCAKCKRPVCKDCGLMLDLDTGEWFSTRR